MQQSSYNGYQNYPQQRMPAGNGNRAPSGAPRQPRRPEVQRRRRKRPFARLVLILIALVLAGGGIYYYSLYSQVKPYESVFLPNISIDGIDLSGKTTDQAVEAVFSSISNRQSSWSLALTYQGHTFSTLNYSLMGISTNPDEVYALLNQAYQYGHQGGTSKRLSDLNHLKETPLALYTTQSEMTDANVNDILAQIEAYLEKAPTDAYLASFDPDAADPFTIQPEAYGAALDTEAVKADILARAARGESGSLEITPTPLSPSVTTADIRAQVTLLSSGTTAISKASEEGRTNNIRLAFKKINGTVLEPGKTFSFNTIVGKRTKTNGFFEAPEYAYGDLVQGVGGGVCQASTTVYLAAVTSNLKITKRTQHSAPVNYTDKGQDATVSDGRLDFKFENTAAGKIYITAHVEKVSGTKNRYQCVVKIYGPTLGDNVLYKLRSVQTETLYPGDPVYKKDTKGTYVTYDDETYKSQSAREGSVVQTYLQRWENGKMVEETLITTDRYEARPETYYVGVKKRL